MAKVMAMEAHGCGVESTTEAGRSGWTVPFGGAEVHLMRVVSAALPREGAPAPLRHPSFPLCHRAALCFIASPRAMFDVRATPRAIGRCCLRDAVPC